MCYGASHTSVVSDGDGKHRTTQTHPLGSVNATCGPKRGGDSKNLLSNDQSGLVKENKGMLKHAGPQVASNVGTERDGR